MKKFYLIIVLGLVLTAFFIGDRYNSGYDANNGQTPTQLTITNELTIANKSYYEALPRGAAGHIILEGSGSYRRGQKVTLRLVPVRVLSINGRKVQIYREV